MKKFISLFIIFLAGGLIFLSCKKLISKLFPSFDTAVSNIQIAVPPIPFSNISGSVGLQTIYYNLDSTIKANTGGTYGANDVSSITLKSIIINLQNGDPADNFANFESLGVDLSSNSNSTPVTIATATIPDVASNTLSMDVSNNLNILSYFQGNQLTYNVFGKVRRATYHQLNGLATITVTVK
ncbi:MAG: hypothetical protein ABJA71_12005 [Ginsengibacter sp.]